MEEVSVLNGFVRLDGALATDISVVNAARVSFNTHKDVMDESDEGLIRFLMRERHGTPFEHNAFRFHIKCPIFVMREWIRHRVGSFNEMSGRYTELKEDFYVPEYVRSQVGKPGAYRFEPVEPLLAVAVRQDMENTYEAAYEAYRRLLNDGIAKEVARMVLPVGIMTEFYWTVNARSLMNFLSLRNSDHAQYEIREYAEAMEHVFEQEMPITYEAFVLYDRTAP
jgi:thymidylate synthase (FAD)